jgi:hypothetical protein
LEARGNALQIRDLDFLGGLCASTLKIAVQDLTTKTQRHKETRKNYKILVSWCLSGKNIFILDGAPRGIWTAVKNRYQHKKVTVHREREN